MGVDFQAVLSLLAEWGYVLVFIFALGESLPFVGILVPGSIAIAMAGFLASEGALSFTLVVALSTVASVVGDFLTYTIARRYGRNLILRLGARFSITEGTLDRGDALFRKYGPAAVVVARFNMVTRGLAPFLAGMSRMRLGLFTLLNFSGSLAWAVAYVSLGYAFGASFPYLERIIGRILLVSLGVAVAIFVLYRLMRKSAYEFTRYDAMLAATGVAAAVAFGRLAQLVSRGDVAGFDATLAPLADALAPALPLWRALSAASSVAVLGTIAVGLAGFLALRRRYADAGVLALSVVGGALVASLLQSWLERAPPAGGGAAGVGFSFPSGHALLALVFLGTLLYVLARESRRRTRLAWSVPAGVGVVGVGLARLGLNAAYPSDLLGGFLAGLCWLSVVLLVAEWINKGPVGERLDRRAAERGSEAPPLQR